MTQLLIDRFTMADRFSPSAREIIEKKRKETGWTRDEVVDWFIVKGSHQSK